MRSTHHEMRCSAAMRAAAVKCRIAAVDGGYAVVAVWKSDPVGSDIDPLHGVFGERAANRGWGPLVSAEPSIRSARAGVAVRFGSVTGEVVPDRVMASPC